MPRKKKREKGRGGILRGTVVAIALSLILLLPFAVACWGEILLTIIMLAGAIAVPVA